MEISYQNGAERWVPNELQNSRNFHGSPSDSSESIFWGPEAPGRAKIHQNPRNGDFDKGGARASLARQRKGARVFCPAEKGRPGPVRGPFGVHPGCVRGPPGVHLWSIRGHFEHHPGSSRGLPRTQEADMYRRALIVPSCAAQVAAQRAAALHRRAAPLHRRGGAQGRAPGAAAARGAARTPARGANFQSRTCTPKGRKSLHRTL